MKDQKSKKLQLNKKVVAKLTDREMDEIKGGVKPITGQICEENSPLCVPPDPSQER